MDGRKEELGAEGLLCCLIMDSETVHPEKTIL